MKRKLFLSIFITGFLLTTISSLSFASTQFSIPPTSEGPGLLAPDSPFYFMDLLKQQVRILFSFTHLQKASTYNQIAGERMGELRLELARDNANAALVALDGLRANSRLAAQELSQAQLSGEAVTELATEINTDIKRHQQALNVLEKEATGELLVDTFLTQASLSDAKTVVEESLPASTLANELHDDVLQQVNQFAVFTQFGSSSLQENIAQLQKQEENIAQDTLMQDEALLTQANKDKNLALQKQLKIRIALEQKKQQEVQNLETNALSQAADITKKSQAVASSINNSQQVAASGSTVVLGASTKK